MSIQIRIAAETDAAAVCTLLRRSIAECCLLDHQNDPDLLAAWLGNKTPHRVASWFASPANFSLVAVEAGVVVGVALLTRAGKLCLCHLLPEARHRGTGKTLLARIEAQAIDWGINAVQLHSTATGAAFYTRHGYIRSGPVKAPYGGQAILFWKPLGAAAEAGAGDARSRYFCSCNSARSP